MDVHIPSSHIATSIVEGKCSSLDISVVEEGQLYVCCNQQLPSPQETLIYNVPLMQTALGLACHDKISSEGGSDNALNTSPHPDSG